MSKITCMTVRLAESESKKLDALAKAAGMSKSQFVRLLVLGAESSDSAPAKQARNVQISDIVDRLDALETALEQLAGLVVETARVPAFIEYRARAKADGITAASGETELQFLIRLARHYYLQYRVWPDPADANKFGGFPASAKPADWPKAPPL